MTDLTNINDLPSLSDDETQDKLRVLLLGQAGTGKTTLGASVAEFGRTAYVYPPGNEGKSSLKGETWEADVVPIRLTHPTQLRDIGNQLVTADHSFEALFIDGWDVIDRMFRKYILGIPQGEMRTSVDEQTGIMEDDSVMSPRDWGTLADITLDVLSSLYGLASHGMPKPIHVIISSQVNEYDDSTTQETLVGAAVSKGCRVHVHSTPDYTLHLEVAEDEESLDGKAFHRVRLLPHERVVTKLHMPYEAKKKMPTVVGTPDQRLTMVKFAKMVGVA